MSFDIILVIRAIIFPVERPNDLLCRICAYLDNNNNLCIMYNFYICTFFCFLLFLKCSVHLRMLKLIYISMKKRMLYSFDMICLKSYRKRDLIAFLSFIENVSLPIAQWKEKHFIHKKILLYCWKSEIN